MKKRRKVRKGHKLINVSNLIIEDEEKVNMILKMYRRGSKDVRRRFFVSYVFFKTFTLTQIFNTLNIQPTYMHKYSSSLSLVHHSLVHKPIQVISHTYVTLEPQGGRSQRFLDIESCRYNEFEFEWTGGVLLCWKR